MQHTSKNGTDAQFANSVIARFSTNMAGLNDGGQGHSSSTSSAVFPGLFFGVVKH